MSENPVEKLIKRRHPDHVANAEEWKFLRKAIEGGPKFVDGNLYKHPKEDGKIYMARLARAKDHYYGLSSQVLATYLGYLFQKPPTAAPNLPEWLNRFLERGDMDGRPLEELAKDVAKYGMGFGVLWIGVDKAKPPEGVDPANLSKAQEEEAGLEPYAYRVDPDHVLDGKIVRGRAVWLLLQEDDRDDADPFASSGEIVCRYRLWTESEWRLFEKRQTEAGIQHVEVAKGPNPIGRVPFVPYRFGSGSGFASPGLLADIAHIDRAILNKNSLLDEIHYAVTFPQLAIGYTGELYQELGSDNAGRPVYGLTPQGHGILKMGLHTVLPYAAEAGMPGYVAPPNEPAIALEGSIKQMVTRLLALALLDGETAVEGGVDASPSGLSKAYTFQKLNSRLATIADGLESAFDSVFELVALWTGNKAEDVPDTAWAFPDNFEVQALASALEEFSALMANSPPSETAIAMLWKEILRKAMPKVEEADWKKIEAEIDALVGERMAGFGVALETAVVGPGQDKETEEDDKQEGKEAAVA